MKKYKVIVMLPASEDGECNFENTVKADTIAVEEETIVLMMADEIVATYPARYTIIELIK